MMYATVLIGLLCLAGAFADDATTSGPAAATFDQDKDWSKAKSIYDFHIKDITGKDMSLDKYRGHVLIVVNVASHCGLTENNYKQLQALYEKYGESKGLRILAFPSNDFAQQEPDAPEVILEFVKNNYNVTFDLTEKVHVNGDEAHPIYKWLKSTEGGKGTLFDAIKWNFTKFIIDKNGQVVDRYAPTTEPFAMEDDIVKQF